MKFQFGVLYRDQRLANPEDLATLLGNYKSWNAETSGHVLEGSLLIGYRGDRITWEEDTETQPFALGPYKLTFDGRLDNRDDVAAKVGLKADRNLPDPVLIAEAYAKYGDSILSVLIGEFALVLWHTTSQQLTFVRSIDGSRPLYYMLDSKRLIWCSDIAHLVKLSAIDPQLNDTYMLEYLLGVPASELTPFIAINAVGTGRALRFVNDQFLQATKLWEPCEIAPIECKADAEYEEQFREKITEAVRVRLRAKGTVFAELSGGLDSSSVVLTADDILGHKGSGPLHIRTFSAVYEQSKTCDERYFIKLVEEMRGVDSIYVSEDEQQFTMGLRDIEFAGLPNFLFLCPGRYMRFIEHMQKHAARVLLTGFGGDHICCSTPYPEMLVADALQNGNLINAHRSCKMGSRFSGVPYHSLLLKKALPLALGPLLPHSWGDDAVRVPPWIHFNGQRDVFFRKPSIERKKWLLPSQRFRVRSAESFFRTISAGAWNAYSYLYVSHPFSHKPLVEFCLAVPMTQMQ